MIAVLATPGKIQRRREASERLKLVDQMRLIEIATGDNHIGPGDESASVQQAEGVLKTAQPRKLFRRHARSLAKHLNKACLAQTDLRGD